VLIHPTLDALIHPTLELEANPQGGELSHAEWLGLLHDREATERYERRLLTAGKWIDKALKFDHRRARQRREKLAGLCPRTNDRGA
jgi:hypothetical protein